MREHLAFAIHSVAASDFLDLPAAVGSVYLCVHLEIFFRRMGGFLEPDGTWISSVHRAHASTSLKAEVGKGRVDRNSINSVDVAYKIFLMDQSSGIVRQFKELEADLPKSTVLGTKGQPTVLKDIGERIHHLRNPAAHGFYSDLSSDGLFYSLLYAIIYFCP